MWPPDWRDEIALIAAIFHPPLTDMMHLTSGDLKFWFDRLVYYTKATKGTK
jgi:hypothetical protein